MKGHRVARSSGVAVAAALVLGLLAGSASSQPLPESVSYCLNCHEDKQLSLGLKDGSSMSLYVNPQDFARSVHGKQLICTDCHARYEQDHPSGATFPSKRGYAIGAYETCKKCHFDTYTRTLESVHYELLKGGLDSAPVCTDCHGAHNIQNPHEKRAMVSRSCATCHVAVYQAYAHSVHGKALVEDGNQDVPACADCHAHHQIEQPGTKHFRLNSPQICIRCHGDARRMSKYGISTTVVQTYLSDFHGVTASLGRGASSAASQVVVTCIDCHGAHDMASPRLKGKEAMKATVAAACAKCHTGASPDFPAAWLSHYEPSLRHAPLVFLVDLFYKIFIPFVVIGLVLQVLLHLYRASAGR
ncbi:MAG: cytochrome c3 family protein [Candidatus Rokubacteria bacterium]|nr:cytochrome c3 family protein [Candidatus Rokubacteria bacterium]MBI3107625.1 cytochrome c3 family protein [Candidatus Rokubacteria bacterium]